MCLALHFTRNAGNVRRLPLRRRSTGGPVSRETPQEASDRLLSTGRLPRGQIGPRPPEHAEERTPDQEIEHEE